MRGELHTRVESASCSNPLIIDAYRRADYPYMDLVTLFTHRRTEIADKIDRNQITDQQGAAETDSFLGQLREVTHQREMVR